MDFVILLRSHKQGVTKKDVERLAEDVFHQVDLQWLWNGNFLIPMKDYDNNDLYEALESLLAEYTIKGLEFEWLEGRHKVEGTMKEIQVIDNNHRIVTIPRTVALEKCTYPSQWGTIMLYKVTI